MLRRSVIACPLMRGCNRSFRRWCCARHWGSLSESQVTAGRTEIVEFNHVPIGVQLVDRPGTHIQLVQLYIAKAFQRRGLGTELLERLFVEAKGSNLPIRLRVLAVNPAKALYERLGFVVVEKTPERLFMEWNSTAG
jgi:ribosomal protein S18 acetylase RimI-like enzyme